MLFLVGTMIWLRECQQDLISVTAYHSFGGGVEHPHDTPPYPSMPSPTFAHSSLDTNWQGVTIDALLGVAGLSEPPAPFAMMHCDGGYTTNLPFEDLIEGKALIATPYEGQLLAPEHGGPARLLVPHLYFWKSAKWVRRLQFTDQDQPGFWEELGYHMYGDPWREQRYAGD